MSKLLAFHNDPKIKETYLKRLELHYKADEIVKGIYWEKGKGCAVGCTVEKNGNEDPHLAMEKELGIPKELAYLEDALFEELPNGESKEFPVTFLNAIPVGADLSLITAKFVVWQFEDKKYGLKNIKEVKDDKNVYRICEAVTNAYKAVIKGETVTQEQWENLYQEAEKIYETRARTRAWAWAGAWAGARTAGLRAWARTVGVQAWSRTAGALALVDYEKYALIQSRQLLKLLKESNPTLLKDNV